jgi:multiple sugar transport system substrate-binding protein
VVKGKIGCSAFPGSYEVWDLEKGEWKKFDEPNKVANLQGPSWHGVISRFSHNPDVTYHLYAWLNQPERIFWTSCQGWSGVDPGRDFQFLRPDVDPRQKMGKGSPEDAIKAGWNLDDRKEYTFGFYDNYYNSVTRQEYLRIPGTEEYWDTLELYVQEAVVLGKDTKTQLDKVYEEWERITDTLGRDKQRLYYQQDIGYGRPVG